MAVTIDAAALSTALRLGSTAEEAAEVLRLLSFATVAVERHAANAPDVVENEAVIRTAGYLFDMPNAGRGAAFADGLRNSGAAGILLPYREHRAGSTADAEAADEASGGMAGTDQTARDAAAAAQATAVLRQTGSEAVTASTVNRWVLTALAFPTTAVFGVQVDPPTGASTGVELGRTADLLDAGVVAGGDANAAIGAQQYAVAAATVGGVLFFASSTAGTFTVRIFEHAA